jgi:ParB/RepB/Spo0J family partition protein
MDLEHHKLELRYEGLRVRRPAKERQVLASLASHGQQVPIVVVVATDMDGRYVVVDGYKRVRALRRLGKDLVKATQWHMNEVDALLLSRSLRSTESESALEQGWLLAELQTSFGLDQEELAQRFDRSQSWVSRRLALVNELPISVQEEVRRGRIGAHAAMKYLVPMARAKKEDCERLAQEIAPLGLSTREIGGLYVVWRSSGPEVRERVLSEPKLFIKAKREVDQVEPPVPTVTELLRDVDLAGTLIRRVIRRLSKFRPDWQEIEQLGSCVCQTMRDLERLQRKIDKEEASAASRSAGGDSGAAPAASELAQDRAHPGDRQGDGEEGDPLRIVHAFANPPGGESGTLPAGDPRPACQVQRQPAAGA